MSDTTKATPGPWRSENVSTNEGHRIRIVAGIEPDTTTIAVLYGALGEALEMEADAALIVAAPDLLRQRDALAAALRSAVEYLDCRIRPGRSVDMPSPGCDCCACVDLTAARAALRDVEGTVTP